MDKSYLERIEELFKDPFSFTAEKMQVVIAETMEHLKDLKERFESDDPQVREKAKEMALEVQAGLSKQVEHLCKATGLDMAQLTSLAATHVAPEEKAQLDEADSQFKALFSKEENETAPKSHRMKKRNKINLVG